MGTSLWFSANGASDDLRRVWSLTPADLGWLTNAVQAGFIVGTIGSAATGLADRFPASRIFVVASLAGAAANAAFALLATGLVPAMAMRFAVGLSLAGIYPLGMKLVVRWAPARAAQSLGWLVGMLTLGTALPHGVRAIGATLPWQAVLLASSGLALVGAILVGALGDRSSDRAEGSPVAARRGDLARAFHVRAFRASAFAYFGHMWELYAFWTIVPSLVAAIVADAGAAPSKGAIPGWAFVVIAAGSVGCVAGGFAGRRIGSARVAASALAASGLACLVFPFADHWPGGARLALMAAWGVVVVADSPQFSALSARTCPPDSIGGALAMQNGIGFLLTTVSIALVTATYPALGSRVAWLLLPGPVLGLLAMWRLSGPIRARDQPSP